MLYKIKIRGIRDDEVSTICPIPLDEDEFDRRLDALLEDIRNISIVSSAEREGDDVIISTINNSGVETLKTEIKTLLQTESFSCFIVGDISKE